MSEAGGEADIIRVKADVGTHTAKLSRTRPASRRPGAAGRNPGPDDSHPPLRARSRPSESAAACTSLPRRGSDLGRQVGKPRLLGASFGSLAVSNTAISMLELSLAFRLRGAGIVFPAIGHGAVQIAPAARQRGVENDGRDA